MKLNIGSGNKYKKGWVNIDMNHMYKPDIIANIEDFIPQNPNTAHKILLEHVLEHISPQKIDYVICELYRVSKDKAIIDIIVPIGKAWQRWPQHSAPFDEGSDEYFDCFFINGKKIFNILKKKVIRTENGIGDELRLKLEVNK